MTTYTVSFGFRREDWETFPDFGTALDAYIRHSVTSRDGACICSDDAEESYEDGERVVSSGLSEEEKERVELADIVAARWKRLRRRALDRLIQEGIKLFTAPAWSTAELEAHAALELARKTAAPLVEQALDRAESSLRDAERAFAGATRP